jgi:hypothetical protein
MASSNEDYISFKKLTYYSDQEADLIMYNKNTSPRFRFLARSALKHYLGDSYDPQTVPWEIEFAFRFFIEIRINRKVHEKIPYNWRMIDEFLQKELKKHGYTDLKNDLSHLYDDDVENRKQFGLIYYKDDHIDYWMHHNCSMPRYRFLARKVLSHYLGDSYNPHTLFENVEIEIRKFIHHVLLRKVQQQAPYDWNYIDNWFRGYLAEVGFDHLSCDLEIIDAGYHGGKYDLENLPRA